MITEPDRIEVERRGNIENVCMVALLQIWNALLGAEVDILISNWNSLE